MSAPSKTTPKGRCSVGKLATVLTSYHFNRATLATFGSLSAVFGDTLACVELKRTAATTDSANRASTEPAVRIEEKQLNIETSFCLRIVHLHKVNEFRFSLSFPPINY